MESFYKNLSQPFKDFLFRSYCFHCDSPLSEGEQRICQRCWNSLSVVKEPDHTFHVLTKRFSDAGVIDGLAALYYFEKSGLLQSLAHSLKYEEVTSFGVELGRKLSVKLTGLPVDVIIPVPLNRRKERERGYNQSDFLAQGLSEELHIPAYRDAVLRVKYTVTQTHLNADQRKANIAEAFAVVKPELINGKSIAIVDDVITTGSTIQELAKVLKDAGAAKIIAASAGLAKLEKGS